MRIALSVTEFPAVSQTFVLDHAAGLIERGHAIDLHALWGGSLAVRHAEVDRLQLLQHAFYAPPRSAGPSALRRLLALARYCGPGLLRRPRLARALLTQRSQGSRYAEIMGHYSFWPLARRYDLIHAHSGQNGVRLLPLYAAGHLSAPLVVTFHGHDVHGYLRDQPAGYYQPLFRQAAALVVCSGFMRQRLLDLGAPPEKLSVIPNALTLARIAYRERPHRADAPLQLLTIGRLVPFKGIEHLLAALARPELAGLAFCLHVVGDGPLRATLQAQAAALGLAERVVFHGACPRDKVLTLLADSDLYLAPAVMDAEGNTETQGVALLEALASGLPVIASAVGGIPETLGDAAVALLPPGDPAALAAAIADWALNPEADATRALRGRQRVETDYAAAHWIDTLEALYRRCLGR